MSSESTDEQPDGLEARLSRLSEQAAEDRAAAERLRKEAWEAIKSLGGTAGQLGARMGRVEGSVNELNGRLERLEAELQRRQTEEELRSAVYGPSVAGTPAPDHRATVRPHRSYGGMRDFPLNYQSPSLYPPGDEG